MLEAGGWQGRAGPGGGAGRGGADPDPGHTAGVAEAADLVDGPALGGGAGPAGSGPFDDARRLALLDRLPEAVLVVDEHGRILFANRTATELSGHQPRDLVGADVFRWVHPDDLAYLRWSLAARVAEDGASGIIAQARLRAADGRWLMGEVQGRSLLDDPAVGGVVVSLRDLSRRPPLADSPARLRSMVDRSSDVLLLVAGDGTLVYANRRLTGMLGHDDDRVVGRPWTALVVAEDRAVAQDRLAALVGRGDQATARWRTRLQSADGSPRPVEVHAVNHLADPVIEGIVVAARDVAQLEVMEAKLVAQRDALAHEAAHDRLTGLLNRFAFLDLLQDTIDGRAADGGDLAVLFVDLDGFKAVNDALGHHAGDAVLVAVARRLRASLRHGDVLARHGGDEFVVLLDPTPDDVELDGLVARIGAALAEPVDVGDGQQVAVGASTGAARAPAAETDVDALLRAADAAMYAVKRRDQR